MHSERGRLDSKKHRISVDHIFDLRLIVKKGEKSQNILIMFFYERIRMHMQTIYVEDKWVIWK